MTRHPYAFVAAAILLATATACDAGGSGRPAAVNVAAPNGHATGTVSARDRAWLATVHQADLTEIQSGHLAQKKGGSQTIRVVGGMLITDHTRFDADVTRVAEHLGVELPRILGAENVALLQRLDHEAGGAFDRDFVATGIAGHRKVIADTVAEVHAGSSPEVKGLARAALPVLHKHLAMLEKAAPTS
jgi:putative membrane protein